MKLTAQQIAETLRENELLFRKQRGLAATLAAAQRDLPRYQRDRAATARKKKVRTNHRAVGV